MTRTLTTTLAGFAFGAAALLGSTAMTPASAAPTLDQLTKADVQMDYAQHRRGGFHRGGYGGRHYGGRGYGRRGFGGGALIGGLAAGALIGGAIASQAAPTYYAPAPTYYAPAEVEVADDDDDDAACAARFRSYDPASGTYLGYDGIRHPCP